MSERSRGSRYAPSEGDRPDVAERLPPGKRSLSGAAPGLVTLDSSQLVASARASRGQPLPAVLRQPLEALAGQALDGVAVHHDSAAAAAALGVGAKAFTVGRDIFFAAGQFQPESAEGKHLIAHEVAHAIHQGEVAGTEVPIGDPASALEVEADAFADAFVTGSAGPVSLSRGAASAGMVQRVRAEAPRKTPRQQAAVIDSAAMRGMPAADRADAWGKLEAALHARSRALTRISMGEQDRSIGIPDVDRVRRQWLAALEYASNCYLSAASTISNDVRPGALPAEEEELAVFRAIRAELAAREAEVHAAELEEQFLYALTERPKYIKKLRKRSGELEAILARGPAASIASLAAALAEKADLDHDLSVLTTGRGLFQGSDAIDEPGRKPGVILDCTTFLTGTQRGFEGVVAGAFERAGRSAEWERVINLAKSRDLHSVDLVNALKDLCGWKATLAVADTNPESYENRNYPHHLQSLRDAKDGKGLYGRGKSPGVRVDKVVTDYAPNLDPGDPQKRSGPPNQVGLAFLKNLEFGVIALPNHMAVISRGVVREQHIVAPRNSASVIDATPLESWVFKSAVVVAPPEAFAAAEQAAKEQKP